MTMTPLIDAPFIVQIHAISAIAALIIGPFAMYRRKRDRVHKTLGYFWVTLMVFVSVSSFWINDIRLIGPFSPIHALSLVTLYSLFKALRSAIKRDIEHHQTSMQFTYFMSLWGAGLFTLVPDRLMGQVVFDSPNWIGFGVVAGFVVISLASLIFAQKTKLIKL